MHGLSSNCRTCMYTVRTYSSDHDAGYSYTVFSASHRCLSPTIPPSHPHPLPVAATKSNRYNPCSINCNENDLPNFPPSIVPTFVPPGFAGKNNFHAGAISMESKRRPKTDLIRLPLYIVESRFETITIIYGLYAHRPVSHCLFSVC